MLCVVCAIFSMYVDAVKAHTVVIGEHGAIMTDSGLRRQASVQDAVVASECQADVDSNYRIAQEHLSSVIQQEHMDVMSESQRDCFLTRYRTIVYTGLPVLKMWAMQLGTDAQMSEVFKERRETMNANNYEKLYNILKNDAVWSHLYSRYYPAGVQDKLREADMAETAKMVTMVKMEQCIPELIARYRSENRDKYYYLVSNHLSAIQVQQTHVATCDPNTAPTGTVVHAMISKEWSGYCMDRERWTDNVHMKACNGEDADQLWYLDGTAMKVGGASDLCLDHETWWTDNVHMKKCNGGQDQQWYLSGLALKNRKSSKCLDFNTWTGNVYMNSCRSRDSQTWYFFEVLRQ